MNVLNEYISKQWIKKYVDHINSTNKQLNHVVNLKTSEQESVETKNVTEKY